MKHRGLDRRALTLLPLVLTMFCLVSGGPFGLEESVGQSGAGMALLLIVAVPIVWAAPVALMTAELTAAIPVEGGYYEWTKRAFGDFWGFQCGWWTWLYSIADATLYPILFCDYLSGLLKLTGASDAISDNLWLRAGTAMTVIAVFTAINVRGARWVGGASILIGVLLTSPFLVMIAIGVARFVAHPGPIGQEFTPHGSTLGAVFATGLYGVMWNYLGWDNLSTVAEEVDQPQRHFPRALLLTVPAVTALYLLSTSVGLRFSPNLSSWNENNWPAIASSVGGRGLGIFTGFAALASAVGLFVTMLLASSRIPFAMAEDRMFPRALLAIHPRFKTPWIAILCCGALYAVLAAIFRFQKLLEIDVTLYSAALIIELAALVALRRKEPQLIRPYRIPGGMPAVLAVAALPVAVVCIALMASIRQDWHGQIPVLILLATGPIYFLGRRSLLMPR